MLLMRLCLQRILSNLSLAPVHKVIYRELHFKAETYWSVVIAVCLRSPVKLMVWYYSNPPIQFLSLILCQPIRRCCSVWRSSMRPSRAGTATPRLQEASRSCLRTPRNMSALLRRTWECLVWAHTHTQILYSSFVNLAYWKINMLQDRNTNLNKK